MGYLDYQKKLKMYDSMNPMEPQEQDMDYSLGSKTNEASLMPSSVSSGVDSGKTAQDAAAGGAAGGPWGAGIAAVGSLASQYLAQKAADERAKRDRYAAIQKGYGEDQQQAINQIMANNARALR